MSDVLPANEPTVAVVIIGRNEGERLVRCIQSVVHTSSQVVYVDSGSTDRSVEAARLLGAEVVQLDMSRPFTAARARNAGFKRLMEIVPHARFVQFVDGDCEISASWLDRARAVFLQDSALAMVCGRLRERNRSATVYNRLCDMEWHRPPGRVDACGGIVMIRASAFEQCGGYSEFLIAGEDPELCVRIRAAGGEILRLPDEMALHDAAMTRFTQWWTRTRRCGWAYAAGAALHGSILRGGHNTRSVVRAFLWGLFFPLLTLVFVAVAAWNPWTLLGAAVILALYVTVVARIFRWRRSSGDSPADSILYAAFCTLGKPAEALGVLQFWSQRLRRRTAPLIEYK